MAVLTLADAKTHLNIEGNDHDAELSDFISTAEAAIAARVGPLEAVSKKVRVTPHFKALRVPGPAVSITSVTDSAGNTVTVADLHLEERAGLITYNDGWRFTARWYDVEYERGRSSLPDDLLMAIKEQVRSMWSESQRGPTRRPGSSPSDSAANTLPGAGQELTYAVQRMITPHRPQIVGT